MVEFDILIENATIVDGSRKEAYKSSIAIEGDKVVGVGDFRGDAKEVIDASDLTAIPGIIDAHSHADRPLLFFPKCENYVLQGVTSFIGGQCGNTLAPIRDAIPIRGLPIREYIHEIIPYKYYTPDRVPIPLDNLNPLMEKHFGWKIEWRSMADYFRKVEEVGISCNYVPLVGHGTCRGVVLGEDYKRPSTQSELDEITTLIRGAMDDGCIGMSVGLDYDPGVFADRKELVECVSIMNDYAGIFCPHSRRTGRRRGMAAGHRLHDKIDGLREVIDICRATNVRMNIAHLYTGWYINPQGGPEMLEEANRKATLMVIDEALEEDLDISFDAIPSALSMRFSGSSYLCSLFGPWLRELETREKFAEWLRVKDFREEVKEAIYSGKWFIRLTYNPNTNPRWAENITVLKHKNEECENKSIQQIAEERETDPFDVWLDLIVEDPDSRAGTGRGEQDASYHAIFYQHPVSSVGLDISVDDYKYESKVPPWPTPRINTYSAYVGFFDKFVKRQKVLTLEQAVYKTSTYVAERHRLKGRGVIREGSYADIVLLDFPNLKVTGIPLETRRQPEGVEYVFVNGVAVVKEAKHTGATPGRVLTRM